MVVCLLSGVLPKLPSTPTLIPEPLWPGEEASEEASEEAAEPLSGDLIKNHIMDLVLFFFLPDLMKTKQEEVGREEGGEV